MPDLGETLDQVPGELLRTVSAYYTTEVLPGHTIFDLWETDEGGLGSKMTPASASIRYREFVWGLIVDELPEKARILSVGFGTGKVERKLVAWGYEVFGIELFSRALQLGRQKGLRVVWGSGDALPFASDVFHLVYLDGSLGHTPSIRRTLARSSP